MIDPVSVQFEETDQFKGDLKKLSRKYRTLPEDIENWKKALIVAHFSPDIAPESMGFFPLSHPDLPGGFYIAKKFACRSLKGSGSRSGIRIVYHLENTTLKIFLIEIYHKNQKEKEDFRRIVRWLQDEFSEI